LSLVPPDFAHQKNCVYHHPGDDYAKKNDSQNQRHYLAPVKHNPTDVQRHRKANQKHTQRDEKRDGFGSGGYAHAPPCAHSNGTGRKIKTASAFARGFHYF
jgi:hypothetical protein